MLIKRRLGASENSPSAYSKRNKSIRSKMFLRQIYLEWSGFIVDACSDGGVSIEVGATNTVSREVFGGMTCWGTDVVALEGVSLVTDACFMAFRDGSLTNVIAIDTFHHLPDAGKFLKESERVLCGGGRLVMVEPWNNRWARFIFQKLHPEPFDERAGWTVSGDGPMTRANGALPWIVFERDQALFELRFPELRVLSIRPVMPFAFLLSGGSRSRLALPGRCYRFVRRFERWFESRGMGMSALIVVEKR